MRRRDLITVMGSAALLRTAPALAQQSMRTMGAILAGAENEPDTQARITAFRAGLEALGWREGKNLRIEWRFVAGDVSLVDRYVAEIVALKPEVILANGTPAVTALKLATTTIPIMCVLMIDPVGLGLVQSLARPGGNMTGFSFIDPELIGKWREILGEAAPGKKQAALLFNPQLNPEYFGFAHDLAPAPPGAAQVAPTPAESIDQVRAALAAMGRSGDSSLIIPPDALMLVHIKEIAALALEQRVPGISVYRQFAVEGGLMTYGPDVPDIFRRSADYIDRILKGANPAELPVQQPDKFDFVINTKTAAAIGVAMPQTLLAIADEVIE